MLGKAADHFFAQQMRERVVAQPGNSASTSMSVPDRERPGTAHVWMKGGTAPGPQNQLSSDYMPGVAQMPRLAIPPGAVAGYAPMLPGMSGLGALSTNAMLGAVAVGIGAWMLLRRKKA